MRLARENGRCKVLEADFSPLRVDGILLVGAFVHVPHGELPALLSRCTAALDPGGLVLITLKEGDGQATDDRGRTFSLWQDEALRAVFAGLYRKYFLASCKLDKLCRGKSPYALVLLQR